METIHIDKPEQKLRELFRAAFPNYSGRTFRLRVAESVKCASYWDSGSRDYFVWVRLDSGQVLGQVPAQSAFDRPIAGVDSVAIPENCGCVMHTISRGHDLGLTLIVSAANAPALLPAPAEVDQNELIVLDATRSYKSSYAGVKNYRYIEASRVTKISPADWVNAQTRCIRKGFLNKVGAITPAGRNAVGSFRLHSLR